MSTVRKVVLVIVTLALLFWLTTVFLLSPWADASEVRWLERRGAVHTYTVARDLNPCDRYPNGKFKGWIGHYVSREGGVANVTVWRFGTSLAAGGTQWAGSFCYNDRHIWRLDYGGEPPGWANNYYLWHYDSDKTKIVDKDRRGNHQHRVWRTRFYITGGHIECFPRLGIGYNTGGGINYYKDRGC